MFVTLQDGLSSLVEAIAARLPPGTVRLIRRSRGLNAAETDGGFGRRREGKREGGLDKADEVATRIRKQKSEHPKSLIPNP